VLVCGAVRDFRDSKQMGIKDETMKGISKRRKVQKL
jgi:hypothetical protein